jgi:outer membrane protein assembly factor BamB
LYIASGNTKSISSFDYGDGVMELSPKLQVLSYFAPSNYVALNEEDLDLGSTQPILMNNLDLTFEIGKQGVGYLLDQSNLGGINGSVYSAQVCDSAYSADAYYDSELFVPCTNGLFALSLQGSGISGSFTKVWNTDSFTSGAPIVSGNAVWTIDTENGTMLALNPTSGATIFSYHLGSVVHFESPASADGLILAGGNDRITAIQISTR